MATPGTDTEKLLGYIASGDTSAANTLLDRYRAKLHRVVSIRMDERIRGRVDPSDVVQETLGDAARRLIGYSQNREIPFYPWLRRLAIDRLVDTHRRHLDAARRSVMREEPFELGISDVSRIALANRFVANSAGISDSVRQQERREYAEQIIEHLSALDREVLALRYLEQLSTKEAAEILNISVNAFAQRHVRALKRVRRLIDEKGNIA